MITSAIFPNPLSHASLLLATSQHGTASQLLCLSILQKLLSRRVCLSLWLTTMGDCAERKSTARSPALYAASLPLRPCLGQTDCQLLNSSPSDRGPGRAKSDTSSTGKWCTSASAPLTRWPVGQIPVELFELILAYLPRRDVQTMRLVCREFEDKSSPHYFRNVVVPFRAGLYLGSQAGIDTCALDATSFSDGLRIFRSFGPHVRRFALALEIDEDSLSFPPIKAVQEAVPSFWGIYRWPHAQYRRYQDLEYLEHAADETTGMKNALGCLSNVCNLGLCCDAGLGFLCGPDRVARMGAAARHPVFAVGAASPRIQSRTSTGKPAPDFDVYDRAPIILESADAAYHRLISTKHLTLTKMMSDAGYAGSDQIQEALRLMLLTEGTTVADIDLDGRSRPISDSRTCLLPCPGQPQLPPLIPANLTVAQMELLLELEWAHRALIQSYVIAMIDNAVNGCFANLTSLTIAKIPSSHLQIFCRHDFWASIPSLTSLSVGVIADWRSILSPAPGFVEDKAVSPVRAVGIAFHLLNSYVARRPNIKSVHFEWICGGELAPSLYQRNMYILPAPFFEHVDLMAMPTAPINHTNELLRLPHVCHLSLKNCWSAPHVMLQTVRQMALLSLESLELESVSLSGPPTLIPQAPIVQSVRQHVPLFALSSLAVANDVPNAFLPEWMAPGPGHPLTVAYINESLDAAISTISDAGQFQPPLFEQRDPLSWAGLIDQFNSGASPCKSLKKAARRQDIGDFGSQQDYLSVFVPEADRLAAEKKLYQLSRVSFKSCGYVTVDLPHLDTRAMLPVDSPTLPPLRHIDREDLSRFMQRCVDRHMGLILPHIKPQELAQLEINWGMSTGWEGVYGTDIIADAIADGMLQPGLGRFSGVIETAAINPSQPPQVLRQCL